MNMDRFRKAIISTFFAPFSASVINNPEPNSTSLRDLGFSLTSSAVPVILYSRSVFVRARFRTCLSVFSSKNFCSADDTWDRSSTMNTVTRLAAKSQSALRAGQCRGSNIGGSATHIARIVRCSVHLLFSIRPLNHLPLELKVSFELTTSDSTNRRSPD